MISGGLAPSLRALWSDRKIIVIGRLHAFIPGCLQGGNENRRICGCACVCVWTDSISRSKIRGTPWAGIDAKFQIKQMSPSRFPLYISGIVNQRERERERVLSWLPKHWRMIKVPPWSVRVLVTQRPVNGSLPRNDVWVS